jgi:hypothetical protein
MEIFKNAIDHNLFWVQPKTMQRKYELRAGDRTAASLDFKTAFGSFALAVTSEGRWTFKRVGFFSTRVTVRRESEEIDLAVYRPNWSGTQGRLEFMDGRAFTWKTANFWATRYTMIDAAGNALVTYQSGAEEAKLSDFFKDQARVEIDPAARGMADISLLVLIGWYLILLQHADTAVVAAAAS